MENTILIGDHLLVNRAAYWLRKVHRGEVVSFVPPGKRNVVYLKRVVALGGDHVEIRDGVVLVNGNSVAEPYARHIGRFDQTLSANVPKGELFMLGDNRERSEDSRNFGTVPEKNVVGKPVMVLWSFSFPTDKWLTSSIAATYLNHPFDHLRRTRFFRTVQ